VLQPFQSSGATTIFIMRDFRGCCAIYMDAISSTNEMEGKILIATNLLSWLNSMFTGTN
jgi:hypothetical protein